MAVGGWWGAKASLGGGGGGSTTTADVRIRTRVRSAWRLQGEWRSAAAHLFGTWSFSGSDRSHPAHTQGQLPALLAQANGAARHACTAPVHGAHREGGY